MRSSTKMFVISLALITIILGLVGCGGEKGGGGNDDGGGGNGDNPIRVTGVAIIPQTITLAVNGETTLVASISPGDATNKKCTWSSENESVATVSSSGVVIAKATGSTKIKATTEDGGFVDNCIVTVSNIPVAGVNISQSDLSLSKGGTAILSATVLPNEATNRNVTWSSNNESVATVNQSGMVTAIATSGNATITVKTIDGAYTKTCAITVIQGTISVTGVDISQSTAVLTSGSSVQLSAIVSPNTATNKGVSWSSSNETVAIVDSTGKVTAVSTKTTNTTARITVKTSDGGYSKYCDVTVQPVPISISLSRTGTGNHTPGSIQIYANISGTTTNKTVNWSSSDADVATVSVSSSDSGVPITVLIKDAGYVTITAKSSASSSVTATYRIMVTVPNLSEKRGNTMGNTSNLGYMVPSTDGNYIFFRSGENLVKYNLASDTYTTVHTKMTGNYVSCSYMNYYNGYIYFRGNNGYYYKISEGGGSITTVTSTDVGYVNIIDDYLYSRYGSSYRLYKSPLTGSGSGYLNSAYSWYITYYEGWLYYANGEGGPIYKIPRTTNYNESPILLTSNPAKCLNIYNNKIYYISNGNIRTIGLDGTGDSSYIYGTNITKLNIHNGMVNYIDGSSLYVSTNKVRDDAVGNIYCSGNWVLYESNNGSWYKVNVNNVSTIYKLAVNPS